MTIPSTGDPLIARAVAALVAICPTHVRDGKAYVDPDCGACGSRQDAARIYLLGVIDDASKSLDSVTHRRRTPPH